MTWLVLWTCWRDLVRAFPELVSYMHMVSITSFASLSALIAKTFELGANTETFILPVSIWSCTMRGFWNWRRFLRMLLWHVCLTLLPAHVALFLNAMVLVATVVFDYENGGTYYLVLMFVATLISIMHVILIRLRHLDGHVSEFVAF